jgi:hypothetical protein
MSDAYRDPLATLRSQIAAKRAAAADLGRRLGAVRLAVLDRADREGLDRCKEAALASGGDGLDALIALERAVDAWHEALARAIAITDERLTAAAEPPLPDRSSVRLANVPLGVDRVRGRLERDLADVERWGQDAFGGWLVDRSARHFVLVEVYPTERRADDHVGHLAITLRTSVPTLPPLRYDPKPDMKRYQARIRTRKSVGGYLDLALGLGSLLGIVGDAKENESPARPPPARTFEQAFACSGDESLARLVVKKRAREALLELDDLCVLEPPKDRSFPWLALGAGILDVAWTRVWRGDDTDLSLPVGLAIVRAIRRAVSGG